MSYTPHTWGHKETITHEKLNNIEEGIQEAAKQGWNPNYLLTCTNPPSWSRTLFEFKYAVKSGNVYELVDTYGYDEVYVPNYFQGPRMGSAAHGIPKLPGYCLVIVLWSGCGIVTEKSGGISEAALTTSGGSCYEITGDFAINFDGA